MLSDKRNGSGRSPGEVTSWVRPVMSQPPRVCVVGSTNIDLTFRTARLPKPGETLAGHGFQLGYGGKGANQAVMAARLGARVTMIGKVGQDVFGERALENYREQGVDTTHVLIDP